ncbi:hypothetical protein [Guillardia theta]|uniref:Uncharacterized protein n=1 Tax=Guillardia theta TaxID=55529 RepID=Q9AVW2_GUITH|nr:hypothetical protein GTHECHR2187 [Guillardia theta]CAC27109.1 hypothetical protein [Guillardia theta]
MNFDKINYLTIYHIKKIVILKINSIIENNKKSNNSTKISNKLLKKILIPIKIFTISRCYSFLHNFSIEYLFKTPYYFQNYQNVRIRCCDIYLLSSILKKKLQKIYYYKIITKIKLLILQKKIKGIIKIKDKKHYILFNLDFFFKNSLLNAYNFISLFDFK